MDHITYVDEWDVTGRRPGHVYTVDEARARHEAGEPYTVLIGIPGAPQKIITLGRGAETATLYFLDKHERVGMRSIYAQRRGDRLFCEQTSFFDYGDDDLRGERAVHWETTDYQPDGTWSTTEHFSDSGPEVTNGRVLDVEEHWEAVPSFADYRRISRYDDRDA